ncbi:MAG TPA: YkgJ family cysteine cluster protein [Polyangiaceae bacterium]|nr:YkgJ family cysteine cluster protein [Polyangiaceae bacterium]
MPRTPTHRYEDPLDAIWLRTAERVGLRVSRTDDAYASTTGNGELLLAKRAHLDTDDCLAQMIFHELCHSLVQGEESFAVRDWGLDNETNVDSPREQACLRVQAVLAGRHGLRQVLAPTTDYREFWDALPEDVLSLRGEPTTVLAIQALQRSEKPPWAPHLEEALEATRRVAEAAAPFAGKEPDPGGLAPLWSGVTSAPPRHPSLLPGSPLSDAARTCGACAWRTRTGKCRQAGKNVRAEWPGCERFEPPHDCQTCGACCRAAYDCVQISARDPVRKTHPELVERRGPFLQILRSGDRCAALEGGDREPYACRIYDERPKACRDFENGGEHCLTARRRVGLSL